jgi:hypothetical protein
MFPYFSIKLKYQSITMKHLLFKIGISVTILSLAGCSSSPTRENNPDKFDLLRTGAVNKANILKFKNCLIEGFEVRDRIAYNVKTRLQTRTDGYRVESYGGEVLLLLSTDIFNSGKTQLLRVKNSSLTDLSQQISAFDSCLAKYK